MRKYSFLKIDPEKSSHVDAFVDFNIALYGDKPATRNSLSKTRALIKAGNNFDFYLVRSGTETLGRMAVGYNENLLDGKGAPYGQIGLFEVIEDYNVFREMIDFAKGTFSGINNILFPYYISTWHQYRFISKGFERFHFFLENENKEYYSEFSKKYGVEKVYTYKSVMEMDFRTFIKKQKKAYEYARESGITFRCLNKKDLINEMKIIYDLSIQGFKGNNFYTEISFEQFLELYLSGMKIIDPEFFIFACTKEGKPVGYIFSTPDYTSLLDKIDAHSVMGKLKFLLFKNRVNGYIVKSTMVLPEYRNKNIFGALTYANGIKAKKKNFKYLIGALAYTDNISITVITQDRKEKEYELYELSTGVSQ